MCVTLFSLLFNFLWNEENSGKIFLEKVCHVRIARNKQYVMSKIVYFFHTHLHLS